MKSKSKGSVNKNKKKKKAFRGGNYRFDGSAIKKRPAPKKKDAQPSEESSGAAEPVTYQVWSLTRFHLVQVS